MTKPVVLVTGAGGFIGGWVAEALHLSGWDVRAGISRWTSAARIARFPLTIVQCNVMDQASLDGALKGVDVVVHCARCRRCARPGFRTPFRMRCRKEEGRRRCGTPAG